MPRLGQNPAKFVDHVSAPQPVTVALLSYVPFLSGYYREGLDVLRTCLGSVLANTEAPYDLMVFDNASCAEVREYLRAEHEQGRIQFLFLSDRNVGKVGAWNVIFGSAPGEFLAYADSDVYFYPGWLSRHLEVFSAFPEVGTVTGQPRRQRRTFVENTIRRIADVPEIQVQVGKTIPESWIRDHAYSLDKDDQVEADLAYDDYLLTSRGVRAYVTAQHYQFVVRTSVARSLVPFRSTRPMGTDVAQFDEAIDARNLLRLAVSDRLAVHMGNSLRGAEIASAQEAAGAGSMPKPDSVAHPVVRRRIRDIPAVRRALLALHDRIFRLYYGSRR
jgi:hypothetical protein